MTTAFIRFKLGKLGKLGKLPRDLVLSPEKQLDLLWQLLYVEEHCPCGARPGSLNTHPHVVECGIAFLIQRIFECTGAIYR